MRPRDLIELLLLAALWGASFLLMRYAAPSFGAVALVEVRVALAAVVLLPLLFFRGGFGSLRRHAGWVATIGVLNSALPFVLLTYATLTVTAGFAAILNSTTPLWTALIGFLVWRERIRAAQWLGLSLGLVGVVILVWGKVDLRPGATHFATALAVLAALGGAMAYGLSANLVRRYLAGVDPLVTAAGSQVSAAVALAPLAAAAVPAVAPDAAAWAAAVALAVACTAVAYLLYFRLLAHVGAMRAASVTFLIPVFATVWGAALLDEPITLQMLAGGAVILAGTALALGMLAAPAQAKTA
ncbi:MAG TPA: DMT family transporter [Burkholderiaceae bacterium]|nr:DMT family transporter [Burkholderiaceae bacterium]